jgi:hypothetical protein
MRALCFVVLLGGCGFTAPPSTGTVLCAKDGDCAPERCDLEHHVCLHGAAAAAPKILGVSFDPKFAHTGSATLSIATDVALDESKPPVVTFAPDSETLALAAAPAPPGTNGAVFLVDVDTVAEGTYALASVSVTDRSGNVASKDVSDVSLVVDKTAPIILNFALVAPPPGDVYADVGPAPSVEASFLANEPIAGAHLTLGANVGDGCVALAGSLDFRCHVDVTSDLGDGPAAVVLHAVDNAGNEGTASLPIVIDTQPPAIVADSVSVDIETGAIPTTVARSNSVVTVTFVTDENLGAAPTLVLDVDGDERALTLTAQAGRRYTFVRGGGDVVPAGSYPLVASVVDVFGHAASALTLPLPAPFTAGVPFDDGAGTVCPPPDPGGCVDADGDGFADPASCASGDDFDDGDATSFPGALEIPGDGKDNNGAGGDVPADEASGVFVDSEAGNDGNDGSRAHPVKTLDGALARATASLVYFLAARATPYSSSAAVTGVLGVLGGRDPQTWAATGTRSVVASDVELIDIVVDVETNGRIFSPRIVVGSRAGTLETAGGTAMVAVDTTADVLQLDSVDTVRAIRGDFGSVVAFNGNATLTFDATRVDSGIVFDQQGSIVLVNTTVNGGVTVGCCTGTIGLFHARLTGTNALGLAETTGGGSIVAVDTVFVLNGGSPAVNADSVVVVGDVIERNPGGELAIDDSGHDVNDATAFTSCSFGGCSASTGNIVEDSFDDSVLKDHGVDATTFGAPASIAVDSIGHCRYVDGKPDIGPVELP